MDESSADFNMESNGKPLSVIIDPNYKLLRISPDLRVSSIARRGIERFKEGSYAEAQAQLAKMDATARATAEKRAQPWFTFIKQAIAARTAAQQQEQLPNVAAPNAAAKK